jgi:hypothetical protein
LKSFHDHVFEDHSAVVDRWKPYDVEAAPGGDSNELQRVNLQLAGRIPDEPVTVLLLRGDTLHPHAMTGCRVADLFDRLHRDGKGIGRARHQHDHVVQARREDLHTKSRPSRVEDGARHASKSDPGIDE